ncbi:universal stress protein [Helicobacter mustelae]|uniref:Putative UspA domain protein n=1 Tax=Helicobacter mustelae (strain ATCC 43772 / CCUG 25715 / CIP 103759 / LMG 18044 / NCTC 12198 / R85-136P) TaxID=679897 RepID=D3UJA9_HELM1|nr:universal stress protein [Helicobacter mustelae]CBG40584.1 putative UspA domain protein [Helicobacter mustelae 12198]SQH72081.1 UspA domain-containing protein [Helicobacter mustelae]
MKNILFGVHDTEECRQAINTIARLFGDQKESLEITLLHVIPETIIHTESGIIDYEMIEEKEQEEGQKILQEFAHAFYELGFSCKKILKNGDPIDKVLEAARDYELLIIGASESSFLHRIFNSHQDSFVNASPISVLVAK